MTSALSSNADPQGGSLDENSQHTSTVYNGPPPSSHASNSTTHLQDPNRPEVPRVVRAPQPDPPEVSIHNNVAAFHTASRSSSSPSSISNRTGEPPLQQSSFEDHVHANLSNQSSLHLSNPSSRTMNSRNERMPPPYHNQHSHTSHGTRYHRSHERFPHDDRHITSRHHQQETIGRTDVSNQDSSTMYNQQVPESSLETILFTLAENQSKLESIMVQQHQIMTTLIASNDDRLKDHQSIMEQQLSTLKEIASNKPTLPSGQTSPPRQSAVPLTHFERSSTDGISFDSNAAPLSQDPTLSLNRSAHHKPAPPADSDDASIASIHSTHSMQGYQDTKVTIEKYEDGWLEQGTQSKIWFTQLISELASKPYYHSLLTPDKNGINYNAPTGGPNATLFSVLQSKISANFRGMLCINCKMTTATQILQWLHTSTTTLRGNKSTDAQIIATFFRLVWDPSKEPLESFNGRYQELFTQVKDTDKTFPFDRAIDTWINAMPDEFTDLKIKYKKNQLDDVWKSVKDTGSLFITTKLEMITCNIDFDGFKKKTKKKEKEKESETNVQPTKPATIEGLRTRVQTTDRGFFPDDFPTFEKIETDIKSMLANGKTQADVETKFKAPYRYRSCYLCRVLPGKDYFHITKTCPILKQMFPS